MLHQIIQAHGGTLPDDVRVTFANTGKELPETLRFVHECGVRWGAPIVWLERGPRGVLHITGYNSASRTGQPFDALLDEKSAVPDWQARWCTGELKVLPMMAYAASLGWEPGSYQEAIGLRDDEGHRLLKMYARNEKDGRHCIAPLSKAKVVKADVMAFWAAQDFDLELEPWEGNCDFCFATGKRVRLARARRRPDVPRWWAAAETRLGHTFDRRDSVADLVAEAHRTPDLFDNLAADDYDVECGLLCEPEAA